MSYQGEELWLWRLMLDTGDMWQVTCDRFFFFFLICFLFSPDEEATRPIQSISPMSVCLFGVCRFSPPSATRTDMKALKKSLDEEKNWFFGSVLANQPTVHSGVVSRWRVFGYGCWRWWQVTGDRWHIYLFCFGATIHTHWWIQCLPYAGSFFIGATIRTRWEIQCLRYAGF